MNHEIISIDPRIGEQHIQISWGNWGGENIVGVSIIQNIVDEQIIGIGQRVIAEKVTQDTARQIAREIIGEWVKQISAVEI
jgi:hypothetical protein